MKLKIKNSKGKGKGKGNSNSNSNPNPNPSPNPNSEPFIGYRNPQTGRLQTQAMESNKNIPKQVKHKKRQDLETMLKTAARKKNSLITDFDPLSLLAEFCVAPGHETSTGQKIMCARILASYLYPKKRTIEHTGRDFERIAVNVQVVEPKAIQMGTLSLDQLKDSYDDNGDGDDISDGDGDDIDDYDTY